MEKEFERRRHQLEGMDFIEAERPRSAKVEQAIDDRKQNARFEKISEQINELSKLMNLKTERTAIKVKLLEERHQAFMEEVQQRLTNIAVKASDKPRIDFKIEEMLEKHNQVIRTFENRLNQLKRIVENQEVELYKATAELQEARKEIAKLKRG
jgi:hypothetical protein